MLCFPTSPIKCCCIAVLNRKPRRQRTGDCACNTVQLLQCSRPRLSWTMPPNSPELNALITRFRESYSSVCMRQGCRGYEISHPYPYPYPQIFCGYPWISISMDIHGHPYPQTYPLYRLYVSTNIHKGHSSESTVGILVFCTSI